MAKAIGTVSPWLFVLLFMKVSGDDVLDALGIKFEKDDRLVNSLTRLEQLGLERIELFAWLFIIVAPLLVPKLD